MLRGEVSDKDNNLLNEILDIFQKRKASYNKLLIQIAIVKEDDKWKNVFAKIVPLSKECAIEDKVLKYGRFIVASKKTNVGSFCTIVKHLVSHGKINIKGLPEVLFEGEFADRKGNYIPSNDEIFDLGWPANFYKLYPATGFASNPPRDPILSIIKPSFPDGRTAIKNIIGIDFLHHEGWIGNILILLPNYRAKINELKIGSKDLTIKISTKGLTKENIIGKLYCEQDKVSVAKDIIFTKECKVVPIGFKPQSIYFYLIHREDGELLDQREVPLWWLGRPLPRDVIIEIAEDNIRQLINQGEGGKVEFKQQVGQGRKSYEFIESVVAFANSSGGIILVGIDDKGIVIGIEDENESDRLIKLLRSHCDPPIHPEIRECSLDDGSILLIEVKEGDNKPYVFRDKGVYVRAGATDRIATRAELDEFYQKHTQISGLTF